MGKKSDQRKLHRVSWGKLCEPKYMGDMDFKEKSDFNDALLTTKTPYSIGFLMWNVQRSNYFSLVLFNFTSNCIFIGQLYFRS